MTTHIFLIHCTPSFNKCPFALTFYAKKKKDEEFMTATIKELHFVWGDTSISLSLCCLFYFLFSSLFLLYSLSLHSPSVVSLSVSVLLLCSLIFLNSIRRFHFFMIIHWHHWTAKSALSLSLSLVVYLFPSGLYLLLIIKCQFQTSSFIGKVSFHNNCQKFSHSQHQLQYRYWRKPDDYIQAILIFIFPLSQLLT